MVISAVSRLWQVVSTSGPAATGSGGNLHVSLPPVPGEAWPAAPNGVGRRRTEDRRAATLKDGKGCRHIPRRLVATAAMPEGVLFGNSIRRWSFLSMIWAG
jgi:hypothetical protein